MRSPLVNSHSNFCGIAIKHYTQYKTEFNQLSQMLVIEKELLVIFPDTGHCQIEGQKLIDGSENERCGKYIQLFKLLGLQWAYSNPKPLYLSVSSSGLSVSGSYKGYVYTEELPVPPGTVVSSTDTDGLSLPLYRLIEEDWYIYFDGN